eukprot:CAMPEP_0119417138 /NCGR_PEP_ID=MMETSP1335-20130426/15027_1 /TAXON_ID=259385 /ORGANISM="Chrysoculter rhomboideus, Strain RCC1486" /LENGTH=133 /DNA_ID=CAMNT_0007442299 /DNA_START=24 /DNA_END=425 /DNA_ORIENTATION=+
MTPTDAGLDDIFPLESARSSTDSSPRTSLATRAQADEQKGEKPCRDDITQTCSPPADAQQVPSPSIMHQCWHGGFGQALAIMFARAQSPRLSTRAKSDLPASLDVVLGEHVCYPFNEACVDDQDEAWFDASER